MIIKKYKSLIDILPYSIEELMISIEKKFLDGMNWDNYGMWHIDHMIPISKFNFDSINSNEFNECWSLDNLRPMWSLDNLSKNKYLTDLELNSFSKLNKLNVNINYKTVFLTKEYLKKIIDENGKEFVENYLGDIYSFIMNISPTFPKIESEETFTRLKKYIDNVNPLDEYGNIINGRVNSYGNMLLKSRFNSYWNSSYKNNLSPVEVWNNEKELKYILKYRLGINNSGEVFNLSLKELINGISATRKSISFFKPLLASYIYKKYLGDNKYPVVFDPCAGFGGRLLGFKAAYPNGKYIACEPNKHTYNELINLVNEFKLKNVEINNCKFEDFNINFDYDFSFTSIPYFDLEKYSDYVQYNSFDDWVDKFLNPILRLEKCVLNLSEDLYVKCNLNNKIEFYLINNKNHFNKKTNREPFIITILKN